MISCNSVYLGTSLICRRKKNVVSRSSTEAEYKSMTAVTREII